MTSGTERDRHESGTTSDAACDAAVSAAVEGPSAGAQAACPPTQPAGHSLGPLFRMVPLESPVMGRLYTAGLALGSGGVLLVALLLHPARGHMGTHRQLGLPPCGFVTMTGLPCPTCGMTTAFAHTVRGEVAGGLRAQVFGVLLAFGTFACFLVACHATITGRRPEINWYRIRPTVVVWWVVALMVLSWGGKIVWGLCDGTLPAR